MEEVLFERKGAVELVTLNRPEKLNALSLEMITAIAEHLTRLQMDDAARAVVVTGNGRSFCAGADLSGAGGREDATTPPGMRLTTKAYNVMIEAMCNLEKPVIGAINGDAAGGGCNVALACDILIASEEARFIQVFARRGLIADCGGTYFLPRLIGLSRAKEYMFSAKPMHAETALKLGVVSRVVPVDGLLDEAMSYAEELASGPTRAIGMMKDMLNRSFESDLGAALDREAALQGIAVGTADVAEGVAAFLQKRKPEFKGR